MLNKHIINDHYRISASGTSLAARKSSLARISLVYITMIVLVRKLALQTGCGSSSRRAVRLTA